MASQRLEWTVSAGVAGWALARLLAADRIAVAEAWTVPWLAFTPHAAAAACTAPLVMRGRGSRWATGLAGVVLAGTVLPRSVSRRQPDVCGPVLRVLTANLLGGQADPDALVSLVRAAAADVLFVQDLDDEATARLDQAGLGDLLGWRLTRPVADSPRGGGIYARHPLRADPQRREEAESAAQCSAWLMLPSGHAVRVVCVHAPPPKPWNPTGASRWRGELGMLPRTGAPSASRGPVTVLAGDFNATLDHWQLRRVLRHGYVDAARQAGHGLTTTWGPQPARPPRLLALDHVLVDSRCAVLATSARRLAGSDHRALYAKFRLPR